MIGKRRAVVLKSFFIAWWWLQSVLRVAAGVSGSSQGARENLVSWKRKHVAFER